LRAPKRRRAAAQSRDDIGWVAGAFEWNAAELNFCGGGCSAITQGSANPGGLLIGVGLEYAVTNNWTTKFEYDYLGFSAKNVALTIYNALPVPYTQTQNLSADKHIFKVGVNYKFF
jgi:opacity protein-like surface antigen